MNIPPHTSSALFDSFWLAGFESATHITRAGHRLDMLAVTQHDRQAAGDYALLRSIGIRAARDGIRWHLIDRGGAYDFSSLLPMTMAARDEGVQVIWNLCHYGWPEDVDVFAPQFVDRFARFCTAVARFIAAQSDSIPFYSPINEISFLAWAAGDTGIIYPAQHERGNELKRQLVRAAIAGMEAIWAVDRRARFVHVDPVIHVVAPRRRPDLIAAADAQRASQWESWDMLMGRRAPELGGHPRYLDIVGVNFYHANEWEHPDIRIRWEDEPRDSRWLPFRTLLAEVWERYRRPLFVAETSHFGAGRVRWLNEIADEVCQARAMGVPVEGMCIYPILDRPDWEDLHHWHHSGLWDLLPDTEGTLVRTINTGYADALRDAQAKLAGDACAVAPPQGFRWPWQRARG